MYKRQVIVLLFFFGHWTCHFVPHCFEYIDHLIYPCTAEMRSGELIPSFGVGVVCGCVWVCLVVCVPNWSITRAPIVTAAAALVMDQFGTNAVQTRDILLDTADDLGAPGTDAIFGRGRLNVHRALSPIGTLR